VPVWFDLDGDDMLFVTSGASVKGRAIQREGRVALCVDDERRPYAYVTIEGRARVTEDHDEVLAWSIRLASRYVGHELAQQYGERNAGPGMLLVRLPPEHIVSENNITGEERPGHG